MRQRELYGVPGGAITGPALWAAAKARVMSWERHARDPKQTQVDTLLDHVKTAANTEYGLAHGFGAIKRYEDFRDRVPVRTYADFEPYLERMRKGAANVLWPGLIPFYGQSSGTSNTAAKNKFLPISKAQIGWQQKAGFDVLARYLTMTGDTDFSRGFTMGLLPPGTIKREGPVGVASNPGIMLTHMPMASRLSFLPKPPIRDIEDYDHKLTVMAESYLDHDVRALTGTTCWFTILFDRALAAAKKKGMRAETIADIWPNLGALFGGGVHAEPYMKLINARMGRKTTLIDNYNATEGGIYAASDRQGEDGMMMIPDRGVFFEFIRRGEHDQPEPKRVPLWEVEANAEYSVVVTTCSGLFAYQIGDFVRFTSVFPHRIEFAGRSAGVLSVTQELTTSLEIERAVSAASDRAPATIVDYSAGAEVGVDGGAKGRYLLFVEFERAPDSLLAFQEAFDHELTVQNRVYREHRARDVAILAPQVVPLMAGASRRFMEAMGQKSLQQKFPRIVDEPKRDLLRSFAHQNQRQT